ncbi:hypothetical protein I3842_10G101600 [Carya illinoinensis]|uniref:Uncharacterized protein n=1 Tax=Carya illinoinensis TaxID=32201 RepID=A0A922DXS5_CARIL|nr:hypothetical protein I3842_10G101600 [Carya illinoinensis]
MTRIIYIIFLHFGIAKALPKNDVNFLGMRIKLLANLRGVEWHNQAWLPSFSTINHYLWMGSFHDEGGGTRFRLAVVWVAEN